MGNGIERSPGLWQKSLHPGEIVFGNSPLKRSVIIESDRGRVVCAVNIEGPDTPGHADVDLIETAPELADVAAEILTEWEAWDGFGMLNGDLLDRLRTVVSKARGEGVA